jgi:uncharacterized protein YprB with RNaseH-like and TPR domain
MKNKKRLFFDIETSFNIGVFFSTGYNLNINPEQIVKERAIICISYKWEGENEIYNITWDENQCDKKLLEKFITILNESDEAIAHNGDRFDIKWLRTRCLYHNIPMFPQYQTLDTLKMARSNFYFNSNKIDYIAKFLGIEGKLPHSGLDMWKKICLHNDKEELQNMINYCNQDVKILEEVYNKMKNYIKPKTHFGVLEDKEKFTCPECGNHDSKLIRTRTTAAGAIRKQMKCNNKNCNTVYTISDKNYTKLLEFKLNLK